MWQPQRRKYPSLCVYSTTVLFISLPTDCASAVVQVLRWLLDMLPHAPAVAAFMVDFEAALWQALYKEFPDASIKGCVIHFAQANILT